MILARTLPLLAGILVACHRGAAEKPEMLKLEPYQAKQFVLTLTVGGSKRRFLFDTGEGVTMISPQVAASIGCKPWGNVTEHRMTGGRLDAPRCDNVTFTAGAGSYTIATTIVYDLARIAGKDAPVLDGAVGLDLLSGQAFTLDLDQRQIILETRQTIAQRRQEGVRVPLRVATDGSSIDPFLGIPTPRGLAWMELDTGNAGPTIFVSTFMARYFGLDANTRERQPVIVTVTPGWSFSGQARVFPDMIMDGNVGTQFLKGRTLTVDLKTGEAWSAPAP
jgi:hypothetical protein